MITRGLIIRQPWIDLILSGEKTWEMRSRPTNIRGKIGLIEQGTGLIVGECEIVASSIMQLYDHECGIYFCYHKVPDLKSLPWKYPWQLANIKKYVEPIKYQHPKGAVTWVNIENVKGLQ